MNPATATREVFWNVPYYGLIYLLLIPTLAIAGWGFYRRVRLWRLGQPAVRFDRLPERLRLFSRNALGQGRTIRDRYAAVFHTGLFAGFLVLIAATTVVFIHEDFKISIMQGAFYLYFQSLIVDVFGLYVLIGVALAGARRWFSRPRKLVYNDESTWILVAIFAIAASGFLVEGWRIAATADPWGGWSPIGYLVARGSEAWLGADTLRAAHRVTWWLHLGMSFGFLAWAPYTKMAHALTSPLNVLTANLDGYGGCLKPIDFEHAERLGVNSLTDFTWKDLLDLDACTECGRCTEVCPANTVGKALSPRDIILDLRNLMHRESATLLGKVAVPVIDPATAVAPAALFQCTTCAACMEACPVHIEQLPKIIDARRFLVMEEANFPAQLQEIITSLESRQHPYKGTQFSRVDWAHGLDLDVLSEMDDPADAEVVFWVGCGGALVERNHKTVQATAKLLLKAGVKFAILGREETCTGDPARQIGNEFLFEMLAKGNVETLSRYGVKEIVTSCPHCFNSFKNEYPHLGGHYRVHHHSQFLERLVAEGRLEPKARAAGKVTFHDPCYLGRHNGVYDAPRELVDAATTGVRAEMPKSRENSFCCGGGGGMAFVDEPPNQRVNQERAQQALDTGADVVAVGCPFCATMLEDGLGARKGEREVSVLDVAELMWSAVEEEAAPTALSSASP